LIDIGAHTGDTTVPMAIASGKGGKVLALEPNPYVYKILAENAKLNTDFGQIIPLQKAATQEPGQFTFHYSDASFCNGGYLEKIKNQKHNHNYTLQVDGINLQAYLKDQYHKELDRLTLIKVDAEGYDKEIIKTLKEIIVQYQPSILVECYKRLNTEERKDLFHTITSMGYQLFKIADFQKGTTYLPLYENGMMQEKHFEMLALPNSKRQLVNQ